MDDQRRCLSTSLHCGWAQGEAMWARSQTRVKHSALFLHGSGKTNCMIENTAPRQMIVVQTTVVAHHLLSVAHYPSLLLPFTNAPCDRTACRKYIMATWAALSTERWTNHEQVAYLFTFPELQLHAWDGAAILRSLLGFVGLRSCCIVKIPPVLSQKTSNNNNIHKNIVFPHIITSNLRGRNGTVRLINRCPPAPRSRRLNSCLMFLMSSQLNRTLLLDNEGQ